MKVLIGSDRMPARRFTVRLLWGPRDCWIGVFTNVVDGFRLIYVCLLPCIPLAFAWRRAA